MSETKGIAKAATEADLHVEAAANDASLLPPFYRDGYQDFMARAQSLDTENVHYWVKKSGPNQAIKLAKGWKPVEDKKELERLGLGMLIQANGRALHIDVELWRRPRKVSEAVQRLHLKQVAAKSAALKATLEAMADDAAGRSRGKVIPFISTGTAGEVLSKERIKI